MCSSLGSSHLHSSSMYSALCEHALVFGGQVIQFTSLLLDQFLGASLLSKPMATAFSIDASAYIFCVKGALVLLGLFMIKCLR